MSSDILKAIWSNLKMGYGSRGKPERTSVRPGFVDARHSKNSLSIERLLTQSYSHAGLFPYRGQDSIRRAELNSSPRRQRGLRNQI